MVCCKLLFLLESVCGTFSIWRRPTELRRIIDFTKDKMRKKKVERTFHYSGLQAYFAQIHKRESSSLESLTDETANYEEDEMAESAKYRQHKITADGKPYRSVAAAFAALGLPMHKHQTFRAKLKAEKKAEFDGIVFELV